MRTKAAKLVAELVVEYKLDTKQNTEERATRREELCNNRYLPLFCKSRSQDEELQFEKSPLYGAKTTTVFCLSLCA